jgi:hypothetical protein
MKNIILLFFVIGIVSCAPKYTASFQNYNRTDRNDNYVISLPDEEVTLGISPASTEIPTEDLMVSTENRPAAFKDTIMATPVVNEQVNLEAPTQKKLSKKKMKIADQAGEPGEGNPKKNALAIIGFLLGIFSLYPLYGIAFSLPAIIISGIGIKSKKTKLAKAGLILGIIGLIAGVVWWILYFSAWG